MWPLASWFPIGGLKRLLISYTEIPERLDSASTKLRNVLLSISEEEFVENFEVISESSGYTMFLDCKNISSVPFTVLAFDNRTSTRFKIEEVFEIVSPSLIQYELYPLRIILREKHSNELDSEVKELLKNPGFYLEVYKRLDVDLEEVLNFMAGDQNIAAFENLEENRNRYPAFIVSKVSFEMFPKLWRSISQYRNAFIPKNKQVHTAIKLVPKRDGKLFDIHSLQPSQKNEIFLFPSFRLGSQTLMSMKTEELIDYCISASGFFEIDISTFVNHEKPIDGSFSIYDNSLAVAIEEEPVLINL